jgi:hypothetical protein
MREARNFVAGLSPNSTEEVLPLLTAFGTKENAYLRQVFGYWEMVASLIVHGTLNAALAYDTLQEMYFVYSIVQPFVDDFREKTGMREFMKNVQKVTEGTAEGKERLKNMQTRRAAMLQRAAAAK